MNDIASRLPNHIRLNGANASDQAKLSKEAVADGRSADDESTDFEDLTQQLRARPDDSAKPDRGTEPKQIGGPVAAADRRLQPRLVGPDSPPMQLSEVAVTEQVNSDQPGATGERPLSSPSGLTVSGQLPAISDGVAARDLAHPISDGEMHVSDIVRDVDASRPTELKNPDLAGQLVPTLVATDQTSVRQFAEGRQEAVMQTVRVQVSAVAGRSVSAGERTSDADHSDLLRQAAPEAARPLPITRGQAMSAGLPSLNAATVPNLANSTNQAPVSAQPPVAAMIDPERVDRAATIDTVIEDKIARVVDADVASKGRTQDFEIGLRVLGQQTHFSPAPPKPVRILSEQISGALKSMTDEQFATRTLGVTGPSPTTSVGSDALRILSIQLEPEQLGAVRAKIELKGNVVQIELAADKIDAKTIIQRESDALVNMLRAAGYAVADDSIRVIELPRNEQLNSTLGQSSTNESSADGSGRSDGDRELRERAEAERDEPADDDARAQQDDPANAEGRRGLYV